MDYRSTAYKKAQFIAKELLNYCSYFKPPIDPGQIAEEIGIGIVQVSFDGINQDISGLYDFENNRIYINRHDSLTRQRFTIAHEIGHIKLHSEWAKSNDYKVLLRTPEFNNDPREIEADAFAAHLLVPRAMLLDNYKYATIKELGTLFGVSEIVINKRLAFELKQFPQRCKNWFYGD